MLGPILEVAMSKKFMPLWREAHFEVKCAKNCGVRSTFGRSDVLSRGRRKGLCTLSNVQNVKVFVAFPKTMAGVGHLTRICKDGFRMAGAVQETCWSEMLGGQAADFLRGGIAFWSIRSSGLLRWFCVTGAARRGFVWPGLTLSWQAQYFRQVEWTNRKTHWCEAISSALNFPFLKEVSQNGFVFDVVNFEKWGGLADLFRFWCCQVQILRKSRWIAACLMLSSVKF